MKFILPLLFICLSSGCISQKYADSNYPVPFQLERVDTVAGAKDELFVKANEWVARTFNSAKDVIQMHDKEAGKIIAKGVMTSTEDGGLYIGTNYISYTLSIDVKDGRCKFKISDFNFTERITNTTSGGHTYPYNASLDNAEHPFNMWPKAWKNLRGDCWRQAVALRKDFKTTMNSKSNNW